MGTWLLLDNQSSTDIFKDENILKNIQKVNKTLMLHTSGGTIKTNMMGTYKGYGDVWYHPKALTNMISFGNAKNNGFKVNYDDVNDRFTIAKDARQLSFNRRENIYTSLTCSKPQLS